MPAALNFAIAFFMTVPISFIVGAPISAMVALTPADVIGLLGGTAGWMKPFGCKENAAVKESATRVPGLRPESLRNPVS